MFQKIFKNVLPSKNERDLRKMTPLVDSINSLEGDMANLSDSRLAGLTWQFRERAQKGESLSDLIPETFAAVRETSKRVLNMRHFDVQLIGGIVLHEGKIAEMKTGEGKTLVATLPVYLNALTGKGVHLITVNDYLAKRDAEWMSPIYEFLGLKVGVIVHGMDDTERKEAYGADITYGTNNEFGFDYLRDNMKYELGDMVQREHYYAIVDEVDSILIDEARTPLIISGPSEESTDKYYSANAAIPRLKKERDYTIDEKARSAVLSEEGIPRVEKFLSVDNLYDPKNIEWVHAVNQALKAHTLFKKDVDYMVKEGEVIIVDEFTGRLMPGRRYSDGLHQALEAKEGVNIESENQTLATITFQNYFRMYDKLAGMTGTADTEAVEFKEIYNLEVVIVPTNQPMVREDHPDVVYRTEKEKFHALIEEIEERHREGSPVLVGTISIEKSEQVSKMLKREGIPHNVLNAKHHEKEAEIIAEAGQPKKVTIATNMAGRGVDIVLGHGVVERGGLAILGTERHESRRIDNQLRGRSGRQGDPGSSRFFLSLEDDLMRIFGAEKVSSLMEKLGMEEGQPIEHRMVTKAIENAQKKVEGHNFEIRKHLIEYDDVMNKQRGVIYDLRKEVMEGEELKENIQDMVDEITDDIVDIFTDEKAYPEEWDMKGLADYFKSIFSEPLIFQDDELLSREEIRDRVYDHAHRIYEEREATYGSEIMRYLERVMHLSTIDALWKDHLLGMDHLKEGIGLRGYGQLDPLKEYQKEGYEMFADLIMRIKEQTLKKLFHVRIQTEEDVSGISLSGPRGMVMNRGEAGVAKTVKREGKKVGRNDPCPCGSGKKYKKCCGKN